MNTVATPVRELDIQTKPVTMPVREHLYDAELQLTGFTEYGVSVDDLMSGRVAPPAEGARFDITFEGVIKGDRLNGTIRGIDYSVVRADGRFILDLRAEITTDDGEKIAFAADGIFADVDPETKIGQIRETVTLMTHSPTYSWVNQLQVWVTGTSNLSTGQLRLKGYAAA